MLPKRTCLLLGAGASSHLSFPLGNELRRRMLFQLLAQKDKALDAIPETFRQGGEDLSAFYDQLAYGNWTSPDAFLEHHREFIKTGKFLICHCLLEFEQPWSLTQNGGWYDALISAIHVDSPEKLRDNNLSIVTFNYDRSIDFRIHKYVENQFGIPSQEAWQLLKDSIPIVHVHGTLGEYPKWGYGDQTSAWERGQDIKIIFEVGENTEEFRYASELLNSAERVVVLGFGFGQDNVRRLRYFTNQEFESRDIVIATGPTQGSHSNKMIDERLAQWGLIRNTHHFAYTAERLFMSSRNPFA